MAVLLSETVTCKIDVRCPLSFLKKSRSTLYKTSRSVINEVPVIILCLDSLKERVGQYLFDPRSSPL